MPSKILLISRHSPYGSSLAKEALDAALAASAYDQDLSILFMDDGVFQLLHNQAAEDIHQKSFSSMLAALHLYGIETLFVHSESLAQRKITMEELAVDQIQAVNNTQIGELFSQQDHLLSF